MGSAAPREVSIPREGMHPRKAPDPGRALYPRKRWQLLYPMADPLPLLSRSSMLGYS